MRKTGTPEIKAISPVELVREILRNTHESLKWVWLIIMALALIAAVENFTEVISAVPIEKPFDLLSMLSTIATLTFLSFLLVFVRFYFGDSRHLDLSYIETQFRYGIESEVKKYTGAKRALDIASLLLHGILFYFLAANLAAVEKYIYFFTVLLFANSIWLLVQLGFSSALTQGFGKAEAIFGDMKRYGVLIFWPVNNLVFGTLLILVTFSSIPYRLYWGLGLTVLNSIVDFSFAWRFYFPNLSRILNPDDTPARRVFVSIPMAGAPDTGTYSEDREFFLALKERLAEDGTDTYCAGETIPPGQQFDPGAISIRQDLSALDRSALFVLIYFRSAHSSVLFEAGYALARGMESIYLVRDRNDLPFLMKYAAEAFDHVHILEGVTSIDVAADLIRRIRVDGLERSRASIVA